jgi:hypothetical protein
MLFGHRLFRFVLKLAIVAGIFLTVSVIGQQILRQDANDPQIQMAEDAAATLTNENIPAAVVPRGALIDPAKSLAPFIAVYDVNGKILESSGVVGGKPPMPPSGVFAYAQAHSEDRVTWQAASGDRMATVIVPVHGRFTGFVLVARSLREVESRESRIELLSLLGFLGAALVLCFSWVVR